MEKRPLTSTGSARVAVRKVNKDKLIISMANEKFKSYLRGDNIENIKINDSTSTEQTERYMRYIKSLIQSNPKKKDKLYNTEVGHNYEIILYA